MIDGQDERTAGAAAEKGYAVEIGRYIAELREAAGETQAQAAYACGTDSTTWSRWERGVNAPGADAIRTIAAHFGVSTDRVLLGAEYAPFAETPDWAAFLATPYGQIAAERGWLDELKRARFSGRMTSQRYQALVHMLLTDLDAAGS